jgi:predicted amidohydrolase
MDNHIPADKLNPASKPKKKADKTVTIGLIQTSVSENLAQNMRKTVEKIEEAAARGAQIVCLQELYRTRYFPQQKNQDVRLLAETVPGESTKVFSELAKKHKIVIIAPLFERNRNGKFYNSATIIDSNGEIL